MNNIIALNRKYKKQAARESSSRLQSISLVFTIVLLLGSMLSCTLTNTSRWSIDGKAMEPNLKDGQVVTAEPVEDLSSLQRGDIIIFEWNENSLIKRLIALPGETIEIREGSIIINGEVYDEPYDVITPEYEREPIKLGEDEYYVLGDNRNDSRDSHQFGPISGETITGRLIP